MNSSISLQTHDINAKSTVQMEIDTQREPEHILQVLFFLFQ